MKVIDIKVPTPDLPELGLPYTWGTGRHWYVRLEKATYWFTTGGLKVCEPASTHRTDAEEFRYATTIRFTDYKDAK